VTITGEHETKAEEAAAPSVDSKVSARRCRFVRILAPTGLLGTLIVALILLVLSLERAAALSGAARIGALGLSAGALAATMILTVALLLLRREIRERRSAEAERARREARMRQLQENMLDGFVVTDLDERITLANASACRLLGYDAGEILGMNFLRITSTGDRERVRTATARRRAGRSERYELRIQSRGRGERRILVSSVPVRDASGGIVETAALLRDVTEARRNREKVEKLARFPAENPNPILRIGRSGELLYANKASRPLLGLWGVRAGQTPPKSILAAVSQALLDGRPEVREVSSGGTIYELIFTPIATQGYVNVYGRDITETRRAEREILEAQRHAVEAVRVKSEFLANMSHEIRTPLNGILGMTELVLDSDLGAEQRESLEMVLSSSQSLLRVVNDVLDFSRLEAGRLPIESVPFSLRSVVGEAVKSVTARAREKELELICDLPSSVPDGLEGDPGRLRQVLLNLLHNAVKFTSEGAVAVSARLVDEKAVEHLELCVSDTGMGIPPDQQRRIFQSFTQVDGSTTRRFGGTGLGLAISSQLVGLMGGRVELESAEGRGSRFRVILPLRALHEAEAATLEEARAASSPAGNAVAERRGPRRILLAEDNSINSRVVRRMLEQGGYTVEAVRDGRQALEALERVRFDATVMDVQMPEMTGLQACRAIRERELREGGHHPVLALTAHAMEGDRERCLEAGMDEYLTKPVRSADLLAALDRLLSRSADEAGKDPGDQAVSILDREALLLQVGGDRSRLRELLESFREEGPSRLADLRAFLAREDCVGIDRAARQLERSLRHLGGGQAGRAAQRLRDMARCGNLQEAERAIASLEREVARLTPRLEQVSREGTGS
jgi:PAS domain S-box-containing protein